MSFLNDFRELLLKSPKHFAPRQDIENSEFTSFCYKMKSSYMCFACDYIHDCFYLHHSQHDKDCMDGMSLWESELSYECMDTLRFYNCDYCWNGADNRDCFLCEDIRGCKNCFGCSGLRQAEYMIFNEKYEKEEYIKKVDELKKEFFESGGWFSEGDGCKSSSGDGGGGCVEESEIMKKFNEIQFGVPHCQWQLLRCENFVGDYSENSKNCYYAFDLQNCEDCTYVWNCFDTKDTVDCIYVHQGQLCYDCMSSAKAFNIDSSFWMIGCKDCKYGYCCHQCENCFGCTNLKYKKYHILNKGYSKEEYFKKVAEIEGELRGEGIFGENLIYLAMKDVELGMPEALENS